MFPGLAVIEAFRATSDAQVVWIGSTTGIERGIVNRFGVPYIGVPAGKLRRYLSLRNLSDVFRVLAGLMRSVCEIRHMKPVAVFSKGGFVSVPPVIAARLLGVPVLTHESDVVPGLATRINARFVDRVLVAYADSVGHFPERMRRRIVVTGNPVRAEIATGSSDKGRDIAGFADAGRPTVFFVGGSQGAEQINAIVHAILPEIGAEWNVIHQTGTEPPARTGRYFSMPFFGAEYAHLLAASDLLVCRAGAGTLWEAAGAKTPMLLVPLVAGSRGDQVANARLFERHNAARVFVSKQRDAADIAGRIAEELHQLAHEPSTRSVMADRASELVNMDATAQIVDELNRMIARGTAY